MVDLAGKRFCPKSVKSKKWLIFSVFIVILPEQFRSTKIIECSFLYILYTMSITTMTSYNRLCRVEMEMYELEEILSQFSDTAILYANFVYHINIHILRVSFQKSH